MSTKLTGVESEVSKEKLMQDLRVVVSDAEELLRATAGQAGEKASAARERIQESLVSAKARLIAAEEAVVAKTKQAAGSVITIEGRGCSWVQALSFVNRSFRSPCRKKQFETWLISAFRSASRIALCTASMPITRSTASDTKMAMV